MEDTPSDSRSTIDYQAVSHARMMMYPIAIWQTPLLSDLAHALWEGRSVLLGESSVTIGPWRVDRSRFHRVRAPMLVRPVGLFARSIPRNVDESKVGGLKAYSDEPRRPGSHLELEILLPNRGSITLVVEVAWVERLPAGAPANFDVGLRYVNANPEDLAQLTPLLGD